MLDKLYILGASFLVASAICNNFMDIAACTLGLMILFNSN